MQQLLVFTHTSMFFRGKCNPNQAETSPVTLVCFSCYRSIPHGDCHHYGSRCTSFLLHSCKFLGKMSKIYLRKFQGLSHLCACPGNFPTIWCCSSLYVRKKKKQD
eukprot:GHVO01035376.1.p2 GENE.GHVO01035376.1~~GHVO01035376.1.p2  ORF type:complete len:105 (+),score=2.19 GHVO01035376.1:332-646(+)